MSVADEGFDVVAYMFAQPGVSSLTPAQDTRWFEQSFKLIEGKLVASPINDLCLLHGCVIESFPNKLKKDVLSERTADRNMAVQFAHAETIQEQALATGWNFSFKPVDVSGVRRVGMRVVTRYMLVSFEKRTAHFDRLLPEQVEGLQIAQDVFCEYGLLANGVMMQFANAPKELMGREVEMFGEISLGQRHSDGG
jgi:hypothetical protein